MRTSKVTDRITFRDQKGREQRVAAYGVCTRNSPETHEPQLLLVRLNHLTTSPGAWTLPGGGLEFGEAPIDGVVREVEEETGYAAHVTELLTVASIERVIRRPDEPHPTPYHAIRIVYRMDIIGGALRHETDNSTDEARWCNASALGTMWLADLVTGVCMMLGSPWSEAVATA